MIHGAAAWAALHFGTGHWFLVPPLCPVVSSVIGLIWLLVERGEFGRVFCYFLTASIFNVYVGYFALSVAYILKGGGPEAVPDSDATRTVDLISPPGHLRLRRFFGGGGDQVFVPPLTARLTASTDVWNWIDVSSAPDDAHSRSVIAAFLSFLLVVAELLSVVLVKVALGVSANWLIACGEARNTWDEQQKDQQFGIEEEGVR